MKKKLLLCALATLMMSMQAMAYDFQEGGIYYNRIATSSRGICDNNVQVCAGSEPYSGDIVIPMSVVHGGTTYYVTDIATLAFNDCPEVTSITLPSSLRTVGYRSFGNCTGLREMVIPDGCNVLQMQAFYGCTALDTVRMLSETPCSFAFGSPFEGCNPNVVITVPCGSSSAYTSDEDWEGTPVVEDCSNGNGSGTGTGNGDDNLGIDDVQVGQINIYPNPATEWVMVETRQRATLCDASGREVRRIEVGNSLIDLRGLPAGVYFIRDGNTAKKLLVR